MLSPAAEGQPAGKVWRVSFIYVGSRQSAVDNGRYGAFVGGLRDLGYVEGKNLAIEARFGSGESERTCAAVAELAQMNLEVIVTFGSGIAQTLQRMTTIPIVVVTSYGPVREGFATSLGRPGRTVTGLAALLEDIFPKHVDLLNDTLPKLSRLAVLSKPSNVNHPELRQRIEAVARRLGAQVLPVDADTFKDLEPAFTRMARERADALIILGDAGFVQHFPQIAALATKHRIASIYSGREYPDAGGLMSYGRDFEHHYRQAAHYVDRILKGAKPGELPFAQPTRFYLVVNVKTAKAMGPTIQPSLPLRADHIVE